MKVSFDRVSVVLFNIILEDVVKATTRAKDRVSRKFAQKLRDKLSLNNVYTELKGDECVTLLALIRQFKKEMEVLKNKQDSNVTDEQKKIFEENFNSVLMTEMKLLDYIEDFNGIRAIRSVCGKSN